LDRKSDITDTENAPPGSSPAGTQRKAETMRTMTILKITMFAVLFAVMLPATSALAEEVQVNYSWTAPTTGTPVDHYVVQHSIDGGQWTEVGTTDDNSFTLSATMGQSHQIRVAGVDASDRQGPYSVASDPYLPDAGAPGQPGKPILF